MGFKGGKAQEYGQFRNEERIMSRARESSLPASVFLLTFLLLLLYLFLQISVHIAWTFWEIKILQ